MQSEAIDKLAEALAAAQGEIQNPERNRTVHVRGETRTGKEFSYDFRYATLDSIIECAKAPLSKFGLAYTQILGMEHNGKYALSTRLMHSSGQWIESKTPLLVDSTKNQEFGSALTFMRRYALTALLGIAAEEDDDANAADGNQAVVKPRTAPAVEAPPEPPPPKGPPHEIPLLVLANGKPDWPSWGLTYLTAVKQYPAQREEWAVANKTILDRMEKEAPRVFKRLSDAMENGVGHGSA